MQSSSPLRGRGRDRFRLKAIAVAGRPVASSSSLFDCDTSMHRRPYGPPDRPLSVGPVEDVHVLDAPQTAADEYETRRADRVHALEDSKTSTWSAAKAEHAARIRSSGSGTGRRSTVGDARGALAEPRARGGAAAGRRGSSPSPYGRCRRTRSADPTPEPLRALKAGLARPCRCGERAEARPAPKEVAPPPYSQPAREPVDNRTGRVGNGQQPAFQCPNGREEPNREQTALSGWDDQPPGLRSRRFIRAVCAVNVIGLWSRRPRFKSRRPDHRFCLAPSSHPA